MNALIALSLLVATSTMDAPQSAAMKRTVRTHLHVLPTRPGLEVCPIDWTREAAYAARGSAPAVQRPLDFAADVEPSRVWSRSILRIVLDRLAEAFRQLIGSLRR
jgi:hypothetical protein